MKLILVVLVAIVMVALPSLSTAELGMKGIGGKIGFVSPEGGIGSTLLFGVIADLGTLEFGGGKGTVLDLEAQIELWRKTYAWSHYYNWSYTNIAIDGSAKYHFGMGGNPISPYAGGGIGLHILKWNYDYTGPGEEPVDYGWDASSTDLVFHVMGGADYPFSRKLVGFAEGKYSIGGWDYLSLSVGLRFAL